MSNEKQETIEDIVREMRSLGRLDERSTDKIPRSLQALGLRTCAGRIEAAWKAERERAEAMRNEKRGNAAAIREALVRCADIINKFGLAEIVKTPMEVICDIEGIITAALSAPPRNCDIYDAESCRMAYHLHGDGLMTMQAFADWLFAPVEEGATNEQK